MYCECKIIPDTWRGPDCCLECCMDYNTVCITDFREIFYDFIDKTNQNAENLSEKERNIFKIIKNLNHVKHNFPVTVCENCCFKLLNETIPNGDDSFLTKKEFHHKKNDAVSFPGLELAIWRERYDFLKILLDTYKVNPNGSNFDWSTPLALHLDYDTYHGVKKNLVEKIRILLDHGANPSLPLSVKKMIIKDEDDSSYTRHTTALYSSFNDRDLELFYLFLIYGADVKNIFNDNNYLQMIETEEDLNYFHKFFKILSKFTCDKNVLKVFYVANTFDFYNKSGIRSEGIFCLEKVEENINFFNFNDIIDEEIRLIFNSNQNLKELCRSKIRSIIKSSTKIISLLSLIDKLSVCLPSELIKYLKYESNREKQIIDN
jgi:hypothetical protein